MSDAPADVAAALADRYRVERELGEGGMATVYLAEDLKHGRKVAIKVLRPELAAMLGAERFLREITTTARLAHPCILPLFDSGTDRGISWYAMPLFTGRTLRDRLAQGGQLPIDEALRIFTDVAGALDHAHRQGVLHRDLKPANILLQDERAVLADFGIALPAGNRNDRLTEIGFSLGTPDYMSPEQASGEHALDARSDQYALGCVLYEMLTGELPFTGPSAQAILARRLMGPAPRIDRLRPVPQQLAEAISRALERDPGDRFSSVAEFAAAVSGESGRSRALAALSVRPRRRGLIVALGVVASLAGAGWVITRGGFASREVSGIPPVDAEARAAYLQAQAQLGRRTQAGLTNAVRLLRKAIARDSNYALAWAGMAKALGWAGTWRFAVDGVPAESLLARRIESTDRALALDSTLVDMWLLRANLAETIDPTASAPTLGFIRRALALDSTSADAWSALGWARMNAGDGDGARAALHRAVSLGRDPVGLANYYYWWRQFDSAAVWADSGVVANPQFPFAHETVGAIALAQGRSSRARSAYEAALRLDTGPTKVRALEGLAEVAAADGDLTAAREFIRKAEAVVDSIAPSDHEAISLGSAYAAIGSPERALAWLERHRPREALHFQLHLKRDLQLDPLRKLPRFEALLVK